MMRMNWELLYPSMFMGPVVPVPIAVRTWGCSGPKLRMNNIQEQSGPKSSRAFGSTNSRVSISYDANLAKSFD